MQSKAYARSNGSEKQSSDRSIVHDDDSWNCQYQCELTRSTYSYQSLSASVALNLIMGIVLLTNILLFILSLRYFHHVFSWLAFFQKERTKTYYQASVTVLILLNCASI